MIKVYSKPNCTQCTFAKNFLTDLGKTYEVIDVSLPEYADELNRMISLGLRTLPVVTTTDISDKDNTKSGFRPDWLETL